MIYRNRKRKFGYGDLLGSTTSSNQTGGVNRDTDEMVDKTGQGVASAFGPLWGALAQLGTGASKAMKGDGTDYKKDVASAWHDPFANVKGIFNGHPEEILPGGQFFAANRMKKEADQDQRNRLNIETSRKIQQSQGVLANYPTYGVPQAKYGMKIVSFGNITNPNFYSGLKPHSKIGCYSKGGSYFINRMDSGGLGNHQNATPLFKQGGKYSWKHNPSPYPTNWALGGNLPQVTDDSDATQLSSNMAVYNGATHENGGIDLDTNSDNQKDIELENNEVIKDDMVLSDRLYPSEQIKSNLRKLGISFNKKDTYASIAERLGKKKGDWEGKLESTLLGESTSAKKMVEKLDNAVESLFSDQQEQKEVEGIHNKFPDGGKIPGDTNPFYPFKLESWKSQGVADSLGRGVLLKGNYGDLNKFFKTPIPNGQQVDNEGYIQTGAGGNPTSLEQILNPNNSRPTMFNTITGRTVAHDKMGTMAKGGYLDRNISIPIDVQREMDNNMEIIDEKPHDSFLKKGGWIQHAINPKHKGYCTPMTKSTCTPHRKALAMTFKKHHGFHKAFGGFYSNGGSMGGYEATDYASPFFHETDKVKGFNPNGGNTIMYPDGGFFDKNFGNIVAGAGTAANQMYINQLQTDFQPELAPTPQNTYTDRTNYLKNSNLATFRALSNGLGRSSAQDNLGLKSSMYADTLNATNAAVDREQGRKDAYMQHFQQMLQYNNMFNTQATNAGKQYSIEAKNQKIGLSQQNANNFTNSLIGNKSQQEAGDLDVLKTAMYSSMSGDRGVSERMNELFNKNPKWAKYFPTLYNKKKEATGYKPDSSSDDSFDYIERKNTKRFGGNYSKGGKLKKFVY